MQMQMIIDQRSSFYYQMECNKLLAGAATINHDLSRLSTLKSNQQQIQVDEYEVDANDLIPYLSFKL